MAFAHHAGALQPDKFRQPVHRFARAGDIVNFGISIARAGGDNIDALGLVFLIQALAQNFNIGFNRCVKRIRCAARQERRCGGDIDNIAMALLGHTGREQIAQLGHGGEHALDHRRARRPFMLGKTSGQAVTGIIDQIINMDFALFDLRRQLARCFRFFQIGGQHGDVNIEGFFQFLGQLIEARCTARRQHEIIITGGQIARIIAPNTRRCAGNQGCACFFLCHARHNLLSNCTRLHITIRC